MSFMSLLLTSILILTPPSPSLCRAVGVDVAAQAEVTGEIVEYNIAPPSKVRGRCYGNDKGCAIPVMDNQWVIWTIDDTRVRTHEECHALYQVGKHTRDSASSR